MPPLGELFVITCAQNLAIHLALLFLLLAIRRSDPATFQKLRTRTGQILSILGRELKGKPQVAAKKPAFAIDLLFGEWKLPFSQDAIGEPASGLDDDVNAHAATVLQRIHKDDPRTMFLAYLHTGEEGAVSRWTFPILGSD